MTICRKFRPRFRRVRRTKRNAARVAKWAAKPRRDDGESVNAEECAADHGDKEPGENERTNLVEEADAPLRVVKRERRENGKREQADAEYRGDVSRRRISLP